MLDKPHVVVVQKQTVSLSRRNNSLIAVWKFDVVVSRFSIFLVPFPGCNIQKFIFMRDAFRALICNGTDIFIYLLINEGF